MSGYSVCLFDRGRGCTLKHISSREANGREDDTCTSLNLHISRQCGLTFLQSFSFSESLPFFLPRLLFIHCPRFHSHFKWLVVGVALDTALCPISSDGKRTTRCNVKQKTDVNQFNQHHLSALSLKDWCESYKKKLLLCCYWPPLSSVLVTLNVTYQKHTHTHTHTHTQQIERYQLEMGSNQISNFSKLTFTPAEKEEPIFKLFV